MKKFISGFVIGATIFGSLSGFAVSYVANSVDFKVLVNGKEFVSDPPALAVDGRTYLPLRAMGEALGVPVNWNEELQQAEVGNAPLVSTNYSRNNPAPINTVQKIDIDNYISKYSVAVRVVEVQRGEDAWQKIIEANQFNQPAKDGCEYIIAKIALSCLAVDGDKAIETSSYDFKVFTNNNVEVEQSSVVEPTPKLQGKLFAGGNAEGYVVLQVKKDDANPKIVYGLNYDGSGGIWFSLQ